MNLAHIKLFASLFAPYLRDASIRSYITQFCRGKVRKKTAIDNFCNYQIIKIFRTLVGWVSAQSPAHGDLSASSVLCYT